MVGVIVPVVKALYLCEETDVEGGLTSLYGLFDGFRAVAFPHVFREFTCFAQLRGGLGRVPFHVDVTRADDALIRNTTVRVLDFPDRVTHLQVVIHIEGCVFDRPGVYLVELFCDNTWVADTTLRLREADA